MTSRSKQNPSLAERLRSSDPVRRDRARRRVAEVYRNEGESVARTARKLAISEATVRRWRHFGTEGPESPEPAADAVAGVPGAAALSLPGSEGRRAEASSSTSPAAGRAVSDDLVRSSSPDTAATEARTAPRPEPERQQPGRRESPRTRSAATPAARRRSPFQDFRPEHRRALPPPPAPEAASAGDPEIAATPRSGTPLRPSPASPPPPAASPAGSAGTAPAEASPTPQPRRVAFVLHAHIPWVLGHGVWPHGEVWLAEAVVHAYLPVVAALRRLAAAGHRGLLTVSVTPVLAAQLADPRCRSVVRRYLEEQRAAALALAASHPLAAWWQGELDRKQATWREIAEDLPSALAALERDGVIELASSAATHAYLPLLEHDETIRLQLEAGRRTHERVFGRRPAGWWTPECAYRPAGPWRHPLTGAQSEHRPGIERFLAEQGARWTIVDPHLVRGGAPITGYGFPWAAGDGGAGEPGPLLEPVRIDGSSVVALAREPRSARQVWSRPIGYPGDPSYLEFHKRDEAGGLRLWRVTDAEGGLAAKMPYWPPAAAEAVERHAAHFLELVAAVPGDERLPVVCPFDAELFGHWWYEGPRWLEAVLQSLLDDPRVAPATAGACLPADAPAAELAEGSWGEGGDHRVWANDATAWMWREIAAAEAAVLGRLAAGGLPERRRRAILAQLLLLTASDWPFLVGTGTAADYAAERFRTHLDRLHRLLGAARHDELPSWADEDLAALDLEGRTWREEVPAS